MVLSPAHQRIVAVWGGGWFSEARAGPLIPPHLHFALPVAEAEAAVFP